MTIEKNKNNIRALSYYKYSIIVGLQVPLQASGEVNTVITESLNDKDKTVACKEQETC